MKLTAALVRRNLQCYFRDRSAVMLSLLSPLILLVIYVLFLGSLQVENLRAELPGTAVADIEWFVSSWVFAGIVMITTVSTGLAALGTYVEDRFSGRFREFRVSPIRRWQLILGYQLAAVGVATLISFLVLAIGAAGLWLLSGHPPSGLNLLIAAGITLLLSMVFAAVSSFLLTFVPSQGAYTAVSTIVGTLLGFLAGAYLPLGLLTDAMRSVLNVLPFSPAAMLLRDPLAGDALDRLTDGAPQAREVVSTYYGFDVAVGDVALHPGWVTVGLAALAFVFTGLGAWRIGRTIH